MDSLEFDDADHPCTWLEDAGMWAGATFITAVAAVAGVYGQGVADLLTTLLFNH